MVSALLIAGILSVLAGLLAIVYGVSVQAFSLGNTMIVVGATASCTGMLLIGLWVVVGELKNIARRVGPVQLRPQGRVYTTKNRNRQRNERACQDEPWPKR